MLRESLEADRRDPYKQFASRVKRINYGTHPLLSGLSENNLRTLAEYADTCIAFFNRAFYRPHQFTLCFCGESGDILFERGGRRSSSC